MQVVDQVEEGADYALKKTEANFSQMISTGSTWLDLAISGNRVRGGGIPTGILVEIHGPSSSGKTALLAEIIASALSRNAEAVFLDPEGRLDREYASIYGVNIDKDKYLRPRTVKEAFEIIKGMVPKENGIAVVGLDSIAALSTDLELTQGDERGQKKAKDLHAACRTTCLHIANTGMLVVATNQIQDGDGIYVKEKVPGGHAIPFYSSLRIRIGQKAKLYDTREVAGGKTKIEEPVGIESECFIHKSSVGVPYRRCPLYIKFNYGIDDIHSNLIFNKLCTNPSGWFVIGEKKIQKLEEAITYVEENSLEQELRDQTIDLWESLFTEVVNRRGKRRI